MNLVNTDQIDMFVADIVDVAPKGDTQSMEYPIFAISSKPDSEKYRYENKVTGSWLEIIPSADGRATIHDKDLLIYAFGHIAEAAKLGRDISRRVRITAYDYLTVTKRGTDGKSYKAIGDTLARLRGTVVRSNMIGADKVSKKAEVFGLIDYGSAVTDQKGRLEYFEVVISEQLFTAVANNEILNYNRDYFSLRSPYDRRLYELCRRNCGGSAEWRVPIEEIWHIFGVKSPLKEFRRKIKDCIKKQLVPDYELEYEAAASKSSPDWLIVRQNSEYTALVGT
ncbi:replication initiator protein A [Pseudomaricurvus alkylphenolicus]|uniref:replication initiator protein A n=1 Tax=Pseudomaricurvus alkylphenolicus TaxID=1306991 RepID=UPI0030B89EA8